MLPQDQRLTKKPDFVLIFKKGRRLASKYILIRYIYNDLEYSKWAVVASLKVSKKAVERNLLKRRVRRVITNIKPQKSINAIIYISPEAKKASFGDLKSDIIDLTRSI